MTSDMDVACQTVGQGCHISLTKGFCYFSPVKSKNHLHVNNVNIIAEYGDSDMDFTRKTAGQDASISLAKYFC